MSELTDTQNEIDDRLIPINRVGIKGLRFPVEVREKDGGTQRTVATASLTVDFASNHPMGDVTDKRPQPTTCASGQDRDPTSRPVQPSRLILSRGR